MDLQAIGILKRFGRFWDMLPLMFDRVLPQAGYGATAAAVLAYLQGGPIRPNLPVDASDRPLVANLDDLRGIVDWRRFRVPPERCRRIVISGRDDEDLHDRWTPEWSPLQVLQHAILSAIEPSRGPAVMSTARDEGIRIVEFVAHYRAIGAAAIYLYSNNNSDGSDQLLEALARAGAITYVRSFSTGKIKPQSKAMQHALWRLPELRQHEWVLFVDCDEFLVLPESHDHNIAVALGKLAEQHWRQRPAGICYDWKWFVPGRRYACSPATLLETFRHGDPATLFKTCARLRDVLDMRPVHFPIAGQGQVFVDSTFAEIPQSRSAQHAEMWQRKAPEYRGGQLNHYYAKSFEEFAVKKHRGYGDKARVNPIDFDRFVAWNGPETEANFDPCPELLLQRVRHEIQVLRALPGVTEAEQAIWAGRPALLEKFGGDAVLRPIYHQLVGADA